MLANAQRLAARLAHHGYRIVSGGTDNHLFLVDVFSKGVTGKEAEQALEKAGITVNKNAIPFDQNPPMVASGLRIGTPAVTTRGMGPARWTRRRSDRPGARCARGRDGSGRDPREVVELASAFPLYAGGWAPPAFERAASSTPLEFFAARRARWPGSTRLRASAGQEQMAAPWRHTLEHGGTLMVEAGTGTGKTLAYLVPALATGRRVVVSTGTRNLQDQIFNQGPAVPARAGRGLEISACVMKGRENYLCRYRMAQVEREPLLEDLGEAPWVGRFAEWSHTTRERGPRRDRRAARRAQAVARRQRAGRHLHGCALPRVRCVLADPDQAPGRRVADRRRQPPPVLRRSRGAFEPTARCCPSTTR